MHVANTDSRFLLDDLVIEELGQNLRTAPADGCYSCGHGLRIVISTASGDGPTA